MRREDQVVVPVLGMHRSGTSMLTRMLNILGLELGEPLQPPGFDNPKGFWENRFFQFINVKLLKEAGCNVDGFDHEELLIKSCLFFTDLPVSDADAERVGEYTEKTFRNARHWGWKDPRTVITWPYWKRLLRRLGYEQLNPVIIFRHPSSCAASMEKRGDRSRLGEGEDRSPETLFTTLWTTYYELILSYASPTDLLLQQEDLLFPETAEPEMARCADYLGLPDTRIRSALRSVDIDLSTHRTREREPSDGNENVSTYGALLRRLHRQQRRERKGGSIHMRFSRGEVHG